MTPARKPALAGSATFLSLSLYAILLWLPAKQRALEDGDWLKEDSQAICPDPAGNVIMRIE